ncbi:LuxR family transcriptional regulator [Nocardioides mesophilus]|uniref:LuxR family transcriptional regulator n=1 Tax=Nocardioides mesophilus TaxID=433659 RepID=A0A7G9RG25_9ACTN|nr:LuxR family transcriptional regulator [Nocardioides mesophilus]QNN54550.1 LuxR family transcriptional regulator [Nocardioides mesophilus]
MERGSYGPDDRQLLETTARRIYTNAVAHGSLPADDPRLHDARNQPALDLLLDIGLIRLDEGSNRLYPMDPSAVQAQIVVPLGQQGADLLTESARWADTFSELGQVFRTSPQATVHPITEIHGLDNINNFIAAAVNDCRAELLTAQPHGRRPANALAVAEDRDVKALARGVRMRTLYQHSARHSPATREYVADIISHGAEVRTLDEFFRRLIVVDRQVAVVPASDNHHVAIAIYEKSLIAYLVDIFERSWERAQPFNVSGNQAERHIAADVRAMTIRLLTEGHSDPASAKRLGVSTRTYAGYIAALKDEYGVQTRFQLGYAMGRDGAALPLPAPEPDGEVDDLELVEAVEDD